MKEQPDKRYVPSQDATGRDQTTVGRSGIGYRYCFVREQITAPHQVLPRSPSANNDRKSRLALPKIIAAEAL